MDQAALRVTLDVIGLVSSNRVNDSSSSQARAERAAGGAAVEQASRIQAALVEKAQQLAAAQQPAVSIQQ